MHDKEYIVGYNYKKYNIRKHSGENKLSLFGYFLFL